MPAGLEVTLPLPMPRMLTMFCMVTERVKVCTVKDAVTDLAAVMDTVQVPVPEHAPLQPVKVEPPAGLAVKVTDVPELYEAEQVAPQLIPAGLEVTVPLPVPDLPTDRVNACTAKLAVTEVAAFMVTEQVPVPEQPPPLQPVKLDPPAGDAVSVTTVPLL